MSDADLLLLARARSAWDAAKRDDDENMREASELRLARAWPRPRVAPRRVFALGMATAFAIAALLFLVLRRPAAETVAVVAPPAPSSAAATAPVDHAPPMIAPLERKIARVVATTACRECKVEAGAVVDEKLVVPAGSRVTLGFAFDDGLVDPTAGVDLIGPASATTSRAASAEPTIVIERGVVRVRAPRDLVVRVPGGRVSAKDAVYTVRIDEHGASRIDVEKGRVAFAAGDGAEVLVPAGTTSTFDASRSAAPKGAPAPTASAFADLKPSDVLASASGASGASVSPVDPSGSQAKTLEEILAQARVRAKNGDTGARSELERIASSGDARVARRASFMLAELDLAAGAKERARVRLDDLVVCPEAALGADAATLLARSHASAADRAEVWRRYIATNPASPYFERAQLERADALLDAGRTSEAKKILEELRRSSKLTDAQQKQLDRLVLKAR